MPAAYLPKRILVIKKIEYWNTMMMDTFTLEYEQKALEKGYFVDQVFYLMGSYEASVKNIMIKNKEFKEFIENIVDEHYHLSKNADGNLHYLWHLYKHGNNAGDYKPFILIAEMHLLKEMGYISDEEIENMWQMIESEDEDNFNLVWLALNTWRTERIKEHGLYSSTNTFPYMNIEKDYATKVLNYDLLSKIKIIKSWQKQ